MEVIRLTGEDMSFQVLIPGKRLTTVGTKDHLGDDSLNREGKYVGDRRQEAMDRHQKEPETATRQ